MNSKVINVGATLVTIPTSTSLPIASKLAPTLSRISTSLLVLYSLLSLGCIQDPKSNQLLPDIYTYRAGTISELRENFENPPREAGPWVYWFWFENVVNRENITRELEEMAEAGIAGVELRCITRHGFPGTPGPMYDPEGWEQLNHQKYEFLSEDFLDILEHTVSEAERLGLRFAMNLGMGWPPGGPWITDEHRSKHLISESREVVGPVSLKGSSALRLDGISKVSAWRIDENQNVDPASYVDLTSHITVDDRLEWDIPEGRWLLGLFSTVPGGFVDKGNGPELDPASAEAVDFHLNYMFNRLDERLSKFYGSTFESMATDSWEYARNRAGGRYWSPALLKESQSILGYFFEKHMYSLLGYGPDKEDRLKDLAHLEEQLIHENYFGRVGRFLNERGLRHRPQVYGRGLERNLFEAYSIVDIPEVEEGVYVPEAVWASRLLGKPITSEEAFTHLSIRDSNLSMDGLRGGFTAVTNPEDMWQATPERLKRFTNAHFARGINRIQYHSFSYSPPGIPEPGWRMYAEIFLNRNVSWWEQWPELNRWMTRNQYVLQSGEPVTEFLVYPQDPNPIDGPFNVPDDQPWTAMNAVDAANSPLLKQMIEENPDHLSRIHNLILLDDIATLEEADQILQIAERGIPIWSVAVIPREWSIFKSGSNDSQTKALLSRWQQMETEGLIKDVRDQDWQTVVETQKSLHWEPTNLKLSYQRRMLDDGELFLISSWEDTFKGEVQFAGVKGSLEIWDAETGEIQDFNSTQSVNGKVIVTLQLDRNDSVVVTFSQRQ